MRNPSPTIRASLAGDAWNTAQAAIRARTAAGGNGILVTRTPHGVLNEPQQKPIAQRPPESTTGMIFRGLFDIGAKYRAQHVTFYTPAGGQAGGYVCTDDSTPIGTTPDTGAPYWVAWPYPTPGVWGA